MNNEVFGELDKDEFVLCITRCIEKVLGRRDDEDGPLRGKRRTAISLAAMGQSSKGISRITGTEPSTIANQLGGIRRDTGMLGRGDLLCTVLEGMERLEQVAHTLWDEQTARKFLEQRKRDRARPLTGEHEAAK